MPYKRNKLALQKFFPKKPKDQPIVLEPQEPQEPQEPHNASLYYLTQKEEYFIQQERKRQYMFEYYRKNKEMIMEKRKKRYFSEEFHDRAVSDAKVYYAIHRERILAKYRKRTRDARKQKQNNKNQINGS